MKLYTICIDTKPIVIISTDGDSAAEDIMEIDSALDTWLGVDLQTFEHEGNALWDGNRSRVVAREATADEADHWCNSRQAAIDAGDPDAGEEDWLIFLVPVIDPTDDGDERGA